MRYLLLILILLAGCSGDPKYDVILLNGKIIDGSGTEPYTGSVGTVSYTHLTLPTSPHV